MKDQAIRMARPVQANPALGIEAGSIEYTCENTFSGILGMTDCLVPALCSGNPTLIKWAVLTLAKIEIQLNEALQLMKQSGVSPNEDELGWIMMASGHIEVAHDLIKTLGSKR